MFSFCIFVLGLTIGYFIGRQPVKTAQPKHAQQTPHTTSFQHKLRIKSLHQSDSDRIRELNLLSHNQGMFLRILKQTFLDYEIAIKQQRFIVLDHDKMPCAIFEYRDGTQAMKLIDQEDGLPLHLYKGMISKEALEHDYLNISKS